MAGVDKFDADELAEVFEEIFEMFSTDEPNAVLVTPQLGERNIYDESDSRWDALKNVSIIIIGNPHKQSFTSAGDEGNSRTWFLTAAADVEKFENGMTVIYRKKKYIIRQFEIKEIRGVDLIGYGMMDRVPPA